MKHLAQAKILMDESHLGYPVHVWYAMGHMAEAEAECVEVIPDEAKLIREERIKMQDELDKAAELDLQYTPDFADLMNKVAKAGMLPEYREGFYFGRLMSFEEAAQGPLGVPNSEEWCGSSGEEN
jgi:hypothetical protein